MIAYGSPNGADPRVHRRRHAAAGRGRGAHLVRRQFAPLPPRLASPLPRPALYGVRQPACHRSGDQSGDQRRDQSGDNRKWSTSDRSGHVHRRADRSRSADAARRGGAPEAEVALDGGGRFVAGSTGVVRLRRRLFVCLHASADRHRRAAAVWQRATRHADWIAMAGRAVSGGRRLGVGTGGFRRGRSLGAGSLRSAAGRGHLDGVVRDRLGRVFVAGPPPGRRSDRGYDRQFSSRRGAGRRFGLADRRLAQRVVVEQRRTGKRGKSSRLRRTARLALGDRVRRSDLRLGLRRVVRRPAKLGGENRRLVAIGSALDRHRGRCRAAPRTSHVRDVHRRSADRRWGVVRGSPDAGNFDAGNSDAGNFDAGNFDAGNSDAAVDVFPSGLGAGGNATCPEPPR